MGVLPRVGAELGGYRIQSTLSRGGMAMVYLAEDLRMGRTVALKVLAAELGEDDSFRERFLRESRVAGAVNHPNVIPVYDAGEHDGLLYISMRYVEGSDLRALLRAEGPLDLGRTVSIVTQAAGALAATHRRDLIHRDVKPANILLVPRASADGADHVYLSDFGLVKHAGSPSDLTRAGRFMGTVDYVAPEQIEGQPVDARTDIYALGCVLFECLTGVPPFRREDDVATIMAHVKDALPRVSELRPDSAPALDQVVATALAKHPSERYGSCEQLSAALHDAGRAAPSSGQALGGARADAVPESGAPRGDLIPQNTESASPPQGLHAGTETPLVPDGTADRVPRPRRSRRVSRGVWVLLGLVVAGLGAALVFLSDGGDDTDRAGTPPSSTPSRVRGAGPWRPVAAAPTARQQLASAVVDGRFWVAGGLTGSAKATDRVEAYDPAIDTWNAAPPLPRPLHHAMAVTYRGELVVIGGWAPRGPNLTAAVSDQVLALRRGRWVQLPALPHPRAAGAAAVVDGRIVVVGGQARGRLVSATDVFDGERWREGADIPTPREHLAAASDGRFVYAVGGRNRSADRNSAALERYDPGDERWSKLQDMPVPSGGLGAGIVKGRLVAVGGEEPTRVIRAVQSFDPGSGRWSALGSMRTPRHGLAVVAGADTLYALNGAQAPGHLRSTAKGEALDIR